MRAPADALVGRRMVVAQRMDKKEQFAKHLLGLNQSFHDWLKSQVEDDASLDLSAGFQVLVCAS